jgi:DNA-binding NarL/FixJ family response regulator
MEVVGEAENGRNAIKLAEKLMPDLIIMDVSMPDMNGIEATRRIIAAIHDVKVIALSMHSDRRFVLGMLEAGASGYLLKDCAFGELASAINQVTKGNTYLSPKIADVVVKGYLNKNTDSTTKGGAVLSSREREVLQLIAEGLTAKEIAARLFLSIKTIETHRRNIMQKLNMRSTADLTKYAIREGLASLDA